MRGCQSIFNTLSKKSSFVISSHSIADTDGVCSAALLNLFFPQSEIVFIDSPSSLAKKICNKYNIKYTISKEIKPSETVLVDVSDSALLKNVSDKFFVLIDHHITNVVPFKHKYIKEDFPSTTYVIYHMMKCLNMKPTPIQAELILLGLISDTHRFKSTGSPEIFDDVSTLLKITKNDYREIVSIIDFDMSFSERITFIRSFGKVYSAYREKKTQNLFVITDTDSFTSLVATRLVECLGSNVSVAYAIMDNSVVISMRSSSNMNIHLGQFMKDFGNKYKGEGGGHRHAAGCKLNIKYFDKMEDMIVKELSHHFKLERVEL